MNEIILGYTLLVVLSVCTVIYWKYASRTDSVNIRSKEDEISDLQDAFFLAERDLFKPQNKSDSHD